MKQFLNKFLISLFAIFSSLAIALAPTGAAFADSQGFTMSPMNQKVIINPGESYSGSFTLSNPGTNTSDISYSISINPFTVDENYDSVFDEANAFSQIVDWTILDSPDSGTLAPNEKTEINFTINVPYDAPGGGQYLAFIASSTPDSVGGSMTILESHAIAHIVFVEITGKTVHQGEILDASVPSFLFSGNITASSSIRNTGNTHGTATYTFEVYPLFSDEELYTNVQQEKPETHTIIPDRTFYNETTWNKTPGFGFFNVVYTVNFEGITTQVSKVVIVCPLWIFFVIIFVIIAIIVFFVLKLRTKKKSRSRR